MKISGVKKIEKGDVRITCHNCGWSWGKSVGGKKPYLCHQCNTDNVQKYQ